MALLLNICFLEMENMKELKTFVLLFAVFFSTVDILNRF